MGNSILGRLFGKRGSAPADPRRESAGAMYRDEEIRALRDALLPQDPDGPEFEIIPVDGTPEQMAEALIKPSLPKSFFDQVDLGTELGQAQLIAMLISRPGNAGIEKDEIVRFVERNRAHIGKFTREMLPHLKDAAASMEDGGGLATFIDYFGAQVIHARDGHPERIDVKSDRLLWLIYALASQLDGGRITYDEALGYLRKPEHFDRISPLSLVFMLHDYATSVEQPTQPSLCYLMLIGEAARLKDQINPAAAAFAVIIKSRDARSAPNLLRYLDNQLPYLSGHGRLKPEDAAEAAAIRSRFNTKIATRDF